MQRARDVVVVMTAVIIRKGDREKEKASDIAEMIIIIQETSSKRNNFE